MPITRVRPSLELNYKILHAVGLWPLEPRAPKITASYAWRYAFPLIMIVRCSYSPIFHMMSMRASWTNTAIRIEEAMALVSLFSMSSKYLTMYLYRERVAKVFATFARLNEPERVGLKQCERIRQRTDRLCHGLTKGWLTMIGCVGVVVLCAVLAEALHTRSIPTRRWLPYDYSQSPVLEVTAIVSLVLEAMDVMFVCVADALFLVIILQTVAQFQMLRYRLSNISTIVKNRVCRTHRDRKTFHSFKRATVLVDPECCLPDGMQGAPRADAAAVGVVLEARLQRKIDAATDEYLARCVDDHQELIKITHEIQGIFGKMLTSQLLFNAFLASFALYVAMAPHVDTVLVVAVLASTGGMAQLLAYCVCAHALAEESEGVRASAYASDWPDEDERFKRALRLVMCQADRPLRLKAAGLPLNLNTFRMVVRVTWYLFRVVLKIANGEKINGRPT